MISSAYTVIFSFSNASNSFVEKGFYTYFFFCYHDLSLCSLYKTQIDSSLLAPFVDSHYSPRGTHVGRLADFITITQ